MRECQKFLQNVRNVLQCLDGVITLFLTSHTDIYLYRNIITISSLWHILVLQNKDVNSLQIKQQQI